MKKTLITSALPYANGYLHLGHAAGAYLPADIYARFMRLSGEKVLYVCGSDEHGVAITISADKEKITPQEVVDKYHFANKSAFEKFGMTFDIYSRTSIPEHHVTATEFFSDFLHKGYLIEKEEEQFYDDSAQMFLPDRYVEGICPNCGNDRARGDQCDNCGAYYNQIELKNPKSIISGKTPEVRKTSHWYFKLGEFQEFLESFINSKENYWKDNVLAQTKSWLKKGLTDRAITRDLDWGVKIEGIEGIPPEKAKGKRMYVWFDAVLGYITASKVWAEANGMDWKDWWQNRDTEYIAFIGKDNIVFHTLIFPAFLHGKGDYILPANVPANEFLNLEGEKFSKSRNWSIDLKDFLNDFPDEQHTDSLRYTLAMNFPETKDSDFTWKDFQARNNNELASIFGNFINRTLQFLNNNFEGIVPQLSNKYSNLVLDWNNLINDSNNENLKTKFISDYNENDFNLIYSLKNCVESSSYNFRKFRFRDGITDVMNAARAANKYFNDEQPWKTIKSNPEDCSKTIFICCQLVRSLAILFSPITPYTSKKIFNLLNIDNFTGENLNGQALNFNLWFSATLPKLNSGMSTNFPEILFKQVEDEIVEFQISKLKVKTPPAPTVIEEELIDIEDFQKIKLVTAKVISAEKIKKSKKLLKLHIDTGFDKRQILAGVAEFYEPEYLVGKTILVVANLKPAKLMGEESNGMMLAASKDGRLCFVTPEIEIGEGGIVK